MSENTASALVIESGNNTEKKPPTPEEVEFLKQVKEDPDNPLYEALRVTGEIMEAGARTVWYFLCGVTYGDSLLEKYQKKMESGKINATHIVAYMTGAKIKPIMDKVGSYVINAAVAAICARLGVKIPIQLK